MNQLRTCAYVLASLLLAGCAAVTGHGHVTGHLAGRLLMEGGAMGPGGQQPGPRAIPGTVTFAAGDRRVTVSVGPSGTFSVQLPPGRYYASGRSPFIITQISGGSERQLPCSQPLPVMVTAGQTATIAVTCIVP